MKWLQVREKKTNVEKKKSFIDLLVKCVYQTSSPNRVANEMIHLISLRYPKKKEIKFS